MKVDNIKLHSLLMEKQIHYFHHANTISTAITFIEENGLMSRGCVERGALIQTYQSSDEDDKKFDVWDDVFIDIVDLHGHFPRQNLYGPVLFKLSIDFLLEDNLDVWVTKNNPIYWNSETNYDDKYFADINEIEPTWDSYPIQQRMFTIRKPGRPVLFDYLEEIIIDDPKVKAGDLIFIEEAIAALERATKTKPVIQDKMTLRNCSNCYCHSNYLKQVSVVDLKRLFCSQDKK